MRWLPNHGVGVIVLTNLTYARAGALAREALLLMHDTGPLQPRQPAPSAELLEMAEAATQLVLDANDQRVRAAAADNLFIDQALTERKRAITALRKELRDCKRGELRAANALRGTLRIECAGGDLDVTLSLTPEQPPRIQTLEVGAATATNPGTPANCAP